MKSKMKEIKMNEVHHQWSWHYGSQEGGFPTLI